MSKKDWLNGVIFSFGPSDEKRQGMDIPVGHRPLEERYALSAVELRECKFMLHRWMLTSSLADDPTTKVFERIKRHGQVH